jgi:hypothetical protein
VKSAKRERRVWWPAFLLAAIGVLALLVVPQAHSADTPATPSSVQPGPVDKPLRAIIEEETRQRARAPRADKAALRAARDAQAATAPAARAAVPAPPTGIIDNVQVRCRPRPTGC